MQLDDATLRVVAVLCNSMLGGLLLFSWNSNRVNRELLFLGLCFSSATLAGLAMGNTAGSNIPQYRDIGYVLIFFAYGGAWQTARVFERRPLRIDLALAGGVAWLIGVLVTDCDCMQRARVLAATLIPCVYSTLAIVELWRGRRERLPSRGALCLVLSIDIALFVTRGALIILMPSEAGGPVSQWILWLTLFTIIINVAVVYLVLSLIKERLEIEQRAQTLIDPLTGLGNRRALHQHAERILRRQEVAGQSVCVAVIDLDHFKQINDTFGHFTGDTVLRVFAERAVLKLRPTDHLFRVGGEEFLCILQTAQERDAVGIMERIRRTMKDYRLGEGDAARAVTISAGIASTQRIGYDLEDLTRAADSALYRAKHEGRNCVRVYTGGDLQTCMSTTPLKATDGKASPRAT